MAEAWSDATSFRMTVTGAEAGEAFTMTMEFDKASESERFVIESSQGSFESVKVGDECFVGMMGTYQTTECSEESLMAGFNPEEILSEFESQLEAGGTITKGETKDVEGVTCEEWVMVQGAEGESDENAIICVGVDDHLPREILAQSGQFRAVLDSWNEPIEIEKPTV